ncbi:MAG: hypothetical protein WCG25_00915 [bacterium]
MYHVDCHSRFIIQDTIKDTNNQARVSRDIKCQITFQNLFSSPISLKFSSRNACPVQLQKAKYNPQKKDAIKNPR